MADRNEQLFIKAESILSGKSNGFGEPILWHLVMRGYGPAMLNLAGRDTWTGRRSEIGKVCDPYSPSGLMYRAYRQGNPIAAQNMAMTYYNLGNLSGYRHWLLRAARLGCPDAKAELRLFEIRKPHGLARRIGRLRPVRRGVNRNLTME